MMKFQFEANGKKIVIEADRLGKAMTEANKQFGSLPQGAWIAKSSIRDFYWAAGNFFD